jgi:hypothetical protein
MYGTSPKPHSRPTQITSQTAISLHRQTQRKAPERHNREPLGEEKKREHPSTRARFLLFATTPPAEIRSLFHGGAAGSADGYFRGEITNQNYL